MKLITSACIALRLMQVIFASRMTSDHSSESTCEAENHPAHCFLMCIQDCLLYQHIREPTHYRRGQTVNVLDLVLTDGDELVSDLQLHIVGKKCCDLVLTNGDELVSNLQLHIVGKKCCDLVV